MHSTIAQWLRLRFLAFPSAAAEGWWRRAAPAPSGPAISQFGSDRSAYYVGENAQLTAVFANGTGVLQPDDIPVQSGQPVTISGLTQTIRYKLTVTSGTQSVSRDLDLNVSYRERTRAIEMPFARRARRSYFAGRPCDHLRRRRQWLSVSQQRLGIRSRC